MAESGSLAVKRFGPVTIVPGARSSVFPNCTSLFVDGGSERAVIDPGAGEEALAPLAGRVTLIVDTHYHFDHIWGNRFFPGLPVWLNETESGCFPDLGQVGARIGLREFYGEPSVAAWIAAIREAAGDPAPVTRLTDARPAPVPDPPLLAPPAPYSPAFRPEWWLSSRTPSRPYGGGDFPIGRVRTVMVPAPGHTAGFACPFFPDEGLVYTGDIDLTPFGPWYGGTDGDIDAFAASARALLDLDAEWFLTGHQAGLVDRAGFAERLEAFLSVIDERERVIADLLASGVSEAEVKSRGVIYPGRYLVDPWIRMWEAVSVGKHIDRIRSRGMTPPRKD